MSIESNTPEQNKVIAMIDGVLEVPESLRPLVEAYRKLYGHYCEPQKLVSELNQSLANMVKIASTAKLAVPVEILLTAQEVPDCLRGSIAAHAKLLGYYSDPITLDADLNLLFDALVAAVRMTEAVSLAMPIVAMNVAPKIHAVPDKSRLGLQRAV